jgi:hypothetical protein
MMHRVFPGNNYNFAAIIFSSECRCMEQVGKTLIIIGIILAIAGLIIYFAGNRLNWLGHLPGDINIVRENVRIFIPVTTMILISVVLSLIIYVVRKLF